MYTAEDLVNIYKQGSGILFIVSILNSNRGRLDFYNPLMYLYLNIDLNRFKRHFCRFSIFGNPNSFFPEVL